MENPRRDLPSTCSSCWLSRQCWGSRFFIQKMPAVTSGGTCSMYGPIRVVNAIIVLTVSAMLARGK
jgi:hypothetical protein